MPPGMINALLRVPKEATTCTAEDFIECFQRECQPKPRTLERVVSACAERSRGQKVVEGCHWVKGSLAFSLA